VLKAAAWHQPSVLYVAERVNYFIEKSSFLKDYYFFIFFIVLIDS
jgi:hypothetical protein